MRPNVLRMASSLKQEDDGMEDILQTNDDLLRVLDTYKRVVGGGGGGGTNGPQTGGGRGTTGLPEEAGAVGGGDGLGLGGGGGGDDEQDILIDLADLDFGSIPAPNVSAMTPSTADSLLDALGTLGKTLTLSTVHFEARGTQHDLLLTLPFRFVCHWDTTIITEYSMFTTSQLMFYYLFSFSHF